MQLAHPQCHSLQPATDWALRRGKKTVTRLIKRQVQGDSKTAPLGNLLLAGLIPCQARAMAHSPTAQHWHSAAWVRIVRGRGYPGLLLLSAALQPCPSGDRAGEGEDTWRREAEQRQSKALQGAESCFLPDACPMPVCSPTGFKTSLSPAAQRKMLSSRQSKGWLCKEVGEGVKGAQKIERFQSCLSFVKLLGDTWNRCS